MPIKTVKKTSRPKAALWRARDGVAAKRKRTLPKIEWKDLKKVYEVLGRRYDSGDPTVSARHNEHQP